MLEIEELGDVRVQPEVFAFFDRCACTKLVKDVVVPFRQGLENNTRTLEKIGADTCADNLLFAVKENLEHICKMDTMIE